MSINLFGRAQATAILALAVLLGLAGTSQAQQNSLVFPWQAQGGRQSAPVSQPQVVVPNVETSQAFYPGNVDADKVFVDVRIPADAKFTVEGGRTMQTGERRHFVSPPLANGFQYTYHVNATWMENGREVNRSQAFAVRPGDVVHLTFTRDGVNVQTEH